MKITDVRVYGKLLPMASSYNMSSAAVGEPDTTIVQLVTDTKHVGWGEICPTGLLPQSDHAGSIRADLVLLCPALIGLDPRRLGRGSRCNGFGNGWRSRGQVCRRHCLLGPLLILI
jgi:L-alanine-DL-glutamate epimerase-like enolase superfamily enzyme